LCAGDIIGAYEFANANAPVQITTMSLPNARQILQSNFAGFGRFRRLSLDDFVGKSSARNAARHIYRTNSRKSRCERHLAFRNQNSRRNEYVGGSVEKFYD